jgi:hypothetical protein
MTPTTRRLVLAVPLLLCGAEAAVAGERYAVPETVRACPQHGAGFVQVPGSTTCVRISGRVTSEYATATRHISRDQIAGFGTSGRVAVDARTDTAYGPLRSYVRVRAGSGTVQDR